MGCCLWGRTEVFLPGESQGRGSLVGCCLWGRTESDLAAAAAGNYHQEVDICESIHAFVLVFEF